MVWGLFKPDSVSEAYKKMKAEELKGDQHKLDLNKNGKLDKHDFKKLRGEETEEKESALDEEKDLVKTGSKEIKHANIKDKEDDKDDFGPRAQGEKDFLDQLSVDVTDDPARDGHKTGADKLKPAAKPVAKGAGSYNGDSKLSSKDKASFKESASEEDSASEEATNEACDSSKTKGKKTYASFKKEMKSKE